MRSCIKILLTLGIFFTVNLAQAKLTTQAPDLKVSVSNFDKSFVYLKDNDGHRYKYPRSEFAAKSFKIHQTFSVDKKNLQKYRMKKSKKKKRSQKSH